MSAPPARTAARRFMALLLVCYVSKQLVLAITFPAFTGHDELAHFGYVRALAADGRLPTLSADTLPADLYRYEAYGLQWRLHGRNAAPLYTALHPPLYYAAMAPVYGATRGLGAEGRQFVLRFMAIPFGLATVLLAWWTARALFPDDPFIALGTPAIVALHPQVSYEAAMVNNDICAIALYSLLLHLLVLAARDGLSTAGAARIGIVQGLALLAKSTSITAMPLVAGVLWLARRESSTRARLKLLAAAGLAVLVLAGPWYAFLYRTYGNFSGLPQLAALQPGLTRDDATFLDLLFSGSFTGARWAETWGEFGWRLIPLDPWLLTTLAAAAGMALLGLAAAALAAYTDRPNGGGRLPLSGWRAGALLVLAAACVVSYAAMVQFGTRFVLTQARYFFPAANAAAVLAAIGLRAWIPAHRVPQALTALLIALLSLNIVVFTAYAVPFWYFRP